MVLVHPKKGQITVQTCTHFPEETERRVELAATYGEALNRELATRLSLVEELQRDGKELPPPSTRPMREADPA